ncbi:hypothetical protein BSKO_09941 [Bryopsis sp. KO-2023]|nr:hypothetical protein BSKO_09941 [Bryopsis sp. KO-2023]
MRSAIVRLGFVAVWFIAWLNQARCKDVSEILLSDPRLNVIAAGMLTLNGVISPLNRPPYTVLAPTDKAFTSAIREGSLMCGHEKRCTTLLEWVRSSDQVQKVIFRHVFFGRLPPTDFKDGMVLEAVNGAQVKVENEDEWDLRIGGARLVEKDAVVQADNGLVVVIDSILVDYSRLNTSVIAFAELAEDVGPFSKPQREVLVEEVSENVNCFRKVRALELEDGAVNDPSILVFNPILPEKRHGLAGMMMNSALQSKREKGRRKRRLDHSGLNPIVIPDIEWNIPKNVKLPKDEEDLAYMTVFQLAALLRQGNVTSIQLTKLFLGRMRKYDAVLETVVTFTEDLAMEQAAVADSEIRKGKFRSILHGIPYGLKDLIAVPEYPTTWGAAPYGNQTFPKGAWCYEKLKKSGAVLIAKLATGAMAWGDVWFGGRTKNPWNIAEGSCGSSSGSGAATVAGLVPFAIGTETWGSMSCPSETMGVTGFRPTFGSIGRTGVMTLASTLDKVGAFCREALDCAAVVDVMQGRDPQDPSAVEAQLHDPQKVDIAALKIGYSTDSDANVVEVLAELGANMIPMKFNLTVPAEALMNTILGSEAGAHFDQWLRSEKSSHMREQHKWPSYIRSARFIPAVEYIQANRARGRLMREVHEAMDGLDGVIVPARGKGGEGAMGNVLGLPQIVFPTGYASLRGSDGSPRKDPAAQAILGLPFDDYKVLAIGQAYQSETKNHLMRPPIDKVEKRVLDLCLPFSKCDLDGTVRTLGGEEPTIKLSWNRIGGSD